MQFVNDYAKCQNLDAPANHKQFILSYLIVFMSFIKYNPNMVTNKFRHLLNDKTTEKLTIIEKIGR